MGHVPILAWILFVVTLSGTVWLLGSVAIFTKTWIFGAITEVTELEEALNQGLYNSSVDSLWYLPRDTPISDLGAVNSDDGVYGFIFNGSSAPAGNDYYGGYNYCNMPHVNKQAYVKAPDEYTIEYVEVIHRHHKRTPYAANTFPHESYSWDCNDEGLFSYGRPLNPTGHESAPTYYSVYTSPSNPFAPAGFNGTCQFPQITRGGLDDSWQHGKDLYETYHDLLGFIPERAMDEVIYRVTNNPITSRVAGMVIAAMYGSLADVPVKVQPASIDSLEPTYPCAGGTALYSTYGVGSSNSNWTAHLTDSKTLFDELNNITGVLPSEPEFHKSWDHYFDNLSSRLCHSKPLPCNVNDTVTCVTDAQAASVFRMGLYEYSYIYRSNPLSLHASIASYGVYVAELAQNIRESISGNPVKYRHNIAHDKSLAMLLSILQVDEMVWPGLGAEIVFEIFSKTASEDGARWVRILWGGVVLRSSYPKLGSVDMIPSDTLLEYFDLLVGLGASKVPDLCAQMPPSSGKQGVNFCVDCGEEYGLGDA